MLSNLSDMANRSTVYKRHEVRSDSHNGSEAGAPAHPPHQATSHSVGETLSNLTKSSTIFGAHHTHHNEMHHDPHAGERHMTADVVHHQDKVSETLSHLNQDSSIYDRNARRNEFLHSS
eukprot:Nitzschia sp. Nitz4//scaffold46_size129759//26221//26577//NITZ4_003487-RA/size129759-processed-gene-0.131-mRNA-1//1//CDS//3329552553//8238//frame0